MDAQRYSQIRDLFLAADDLPPDERDSFVRAQAGDDDDLIRQVLALLGEHNAEAAKIEGERSSLPSVVKAGSAPAGDDSSSSKRQRGEASRSTPPASTASDSTLRWAQRTHAQPRFTDDVARPQKPVTVSAPRVRQPSDSRPRWPLWLTLFGILLPIALFGWMNYKRAVEVILNAEMAILRSSARTAASDVSKLLSREMHDARSWASDARVRQCVLELVEIARENGDSPSPELSEALFTATPLAELNSVLEELSSNPSVKFAVWDRAGTTLATWADDPSKFGETVSMDHVEQLSRVMRGESVFFGPVRPVSLNSTGDDELLSPVLAAIVPVRTENGRVDAALMIRGSKLYARLNAALDACNERSHGDYYLANDRGVMISESFHARQLALSGAIDASPDELAMMMRVSDPGVGGAPISHSQRLGQPLTTAAAAIVMRLTNQSREPYRNYAGETVLGAWHWLDDIGMGVVVERDVDNALKPARQLAWSFLGLATLLSTCVLGASYFNVCRKTPDEKPDPLLQYEIGEPLGTGGMGVVFRAKHRHLGRPTALKVLRQDRQEPDDLLRFDREARVAAALDSPHIVTVYDYGRTADGEFFTAMQLLRGLTLYEVVARSGPQPIGRVLCILRQVCDAVIDAHSAGLLHRDIKPQNIMLSLDASVGDWAVVFDFGLAKPLEPIKGMYQTSEAIWAGTPMYMAPERFRDPMVMDLRSDIYSLGCVAYFLLSGRPPFSECDPESLFALIISHEPISLKTHLSEPVPDAIESLVQRCMAKNVTDRFQQVAELADALDVLRSQHPWTTKQAKTWWKTNGED